MVVFETLLAALERIGAEVKELGKPSLSVMNLVWLKFIGAGPLQELYLRHGFGPRLNSFILAVSPWFHRPAVGSGRFAKGHLGVFRCLIR